MRNAAKETKAQRVERLKRAKNPWEGLEEIRRFAREGFASIPPEWLGTYFRWWGVYTQGDGAGVTGGQNGEGRADHGLGAIFAARFDQRLAERPSMLT